MKWKAKFKSFPFYFKEWLDPGKEIFDLPKYI